MIASSWEDLAGQKVLLLGSAKENTSLIPHLIRHGADITVCEWNKDRAESVKEIFPKVALATGDDYLKNLDRFDVLFRSPGFPVATMEAALKGLKNPPALSSAIDLFLQLTKSQVVGVTGTKGKGTTSTMIGSILEAAGKKVVVAGNIGRPIFDIFNDLTKDTIVVLELSSFQLEDLSASPPIAVLLPITEDHLQPLSAGSPNYHPSMNDYVAAKARISLYQRRDDVLIYAADNDFSASIAGIAKSKKISVSQHSDDADYFVDPLGQVFTGAKKLVELKTLGLQGQHIFLNATIATAVAKQLGCRDLDISQGLINFRPLPHRLQQFRDKNGIVFVDDSYATTPESAIAAIESFTQPIIWIGGGSSKGANFDDLARHIASSSVREIILLGQEAPKIAESLGHFAAKIPVQTATSLAAVVALVKKIAKTGDVVLLSPACASKDMFKDTADRGDQFQALIHEHF